MTFNDGTTDNEADDKNDAQDPQAGSSASNPYAGITAESGTGQNVPAAESSSASATTESAGTAAESDVDAAGGSSDNAPETTDPFSRLRRDDRATFGSSSASNADSDASLTGDSVPDSMSDNPYATVSASDGPEASSDDEPTSASESSAPTSVSTPHARTPSAPTPEADSAQPSAAASYAATPGWSTDAASEVPLASTAPTASTSQEAPYAHHTPPVTPPQQVTSVTANDPYASPQGAGTGLARIEPSAGNPPPSPIYIADMIVASDYVRSPQGSIPSRGAQLFVNNRTHMQNAIPTWAIVVTIVGFFIIGFFSLLFLLAKEQRVSGGFEVVATGPSGTLSSFVVVNQKSSGFVWNDLQARAEHARIVLAAA